MPKLRNEMTEGFNDNLVHRTPGMKYRVRPEMVHELCAWIALHVERYHRQSVALRSAQASGADCCAAADHAEVATGVLIRLTQQIRDRWSAAVWRDACDIAAEVIGPEAYPSPTGGGGASDG